MQSQNIQEKVNSEIIPSPTNYKMKKLCKCQKTCGCKKFYLQKGNKIYMINENGEVITYSI